MLGDGTPHLCFGTNLNAQRVIDSNFRSDASAAAVVDFNFFWRPSNVAPYS